MAKDGNGIGADDGAAAEEGGVAEGEAEGVR